MNTLERPSAPKDWHGRFFEDMEPGDVFRSRFGRTITESDNVWFTCLTMNTNPLHFDAHFASGTRWKKLLVNSTLTVAMVTGLSVPDTSENAAANLEWGSIRLPNPVFVGDTLYAESEILSRRPSASNPDIGIIEMRCRGINQRAEVVCEFRRTFMIYRATAPEANPRFPETEATWTV